MKSIFTIKGIGLAALLAPIVWLAAGCESMNQLAELGTGIAVATGSISTNEAASITRTTQAVTKTFQDITPEQEYYIGRTVAATVLLGYPPKPAEKLNDYVNLVGQSLAKFSARPETFGGYHFLVLDSDEINAFAAPGGLVLVTRGLLQCCQSEDELAAVLAHEIGHVEKLHGLRAIKTGRLNSALTILAVEGAKTFGGENLAEVTQAFDESINDITTTLMNSGYSRRLEYEADAAAVAILKKAGYQPGALAAMLENMQRNWNPTRKDFAATHPPPADRIQQLARVGVAATKDTNPTRQQRFLAAMKAL
ncbi:MAG: M48 family metallopeptidase [Kiritimatiellae bacterium]|jgi:predicted Zn-dependent protease|nr:M48 family metallopeptidase [Kiritimatiellia bacterium]NLD90380.1 M48 family metalloprotease [Lentisphaerota bacterium]HOU20783.1 M48 family metallopeptidase [Kiritimatiellia bacterium]HPC19464.1 M48 family metallopeptidase [Kiritimatiellia bacterium]HQQ61376.1 M48 family metallopeptidase [Kiritimatiellia bacterium]